MKYNEWLDLWLQKYVKIAVKLKTYDYYKRLINTHIKPMLGEYDLDNMSPSLLQDFVIQKLEQGNLITGNALAKGSVINIARLVKQSINEAYNLNITNINNSAKIKLPSNPETKITAFEKYEQSIIEKYCLHNRKNNYIGIILCLYTGIRIGELLALTWEDIDFKNKFVSITKTACEIKNKDKLCIYVDTPKTKNSIRIIPLSTAILNLLKAKYKTSTSKFVISTKSNNMVGTRSYQKTFERILKKLQLPHKNFHSLRHTFATRAIEFGMDIKTLSEILGHKNPAITLQRYAHSLTAHKIDIMNKFGKTLSY